MRRWQVVVAAFLGIALTSAAAYAAPEPAPAEKPVKAPAPRPVPPNLRYVPERPFDVLSRLFDLNEEQRKKVSDLRKQWYADRQEAMERISAELDAKYLEPLMGVLDEESQARFTKVQAATAVCRDALAKAQEEFHAEWQKLTASTLRYTPYSPSQVLMTLPGLDAQTRAKLRRTFYRDLYRDLADRTKKALEEQGVERPADMKNADARTDYYRKRAELQREVRGTLESEAMAKIKGELPEETRKTLDGLLTAFDALQAKRDAATSILMTALQDLVPPEKLSALSYARPPVEVRQQGGQPPIRMFRER